jgi:hypothetical protein
MESEFVADWIDITEPIAPSVVAIIIEEREKNIRPGLPIWVELLVTSAPDFAIQIKGFVRAKGRDLGARDG